MQREMDNLRSERDKTLAAIRDLEMGNDELERNERLVLVWDSLTSSVAASSLLDMEIKYNRAIEEKTLLEQEVIQNQEVGEECQRLKDDIRGEAGCVQADTQMRTTKLPYCATSLRERPFPLRPRQVPMLPLWTSLGAFPGHRMFPRELNPRHLQMCLVPRTQAGTRTALTGRPPSLPGLYTPRLVSHARQLSRLYLRLLNARRLEQTRPLASLVRRPRAICQLRQLHRALHDELYRPRPRPRETRDSSSCMTSRRVSRRQTIRLGATSNATFLALLRIDPA